MIVYCVNRYDLDEITAHEAERVSAKSVWLKHRTNRTARHASYHKYFDSFEEARLHLIRRAKSTAKSAADQLLEANKAIEKLSKMKPPKVRKEST